MFLERYKQILKQGATINLKCDSDLMYEYTLEVIEKENLPLYENLSNVYNKDEVSKEMQIKTFYEKIWLKEGRTIKYIQFGLN